MNKGLKIKYDLDEIKIWTDKSLPSYIIKFNNTQISLKTPKGFLTINDFYLTDREKLKLEEILLTIKEYREAMALSELEQFINEKESKLADINDLDNDDE